MNTVKKKIESTVTQYKAWHIPQLHLPMAVSRLVPLKVKLFVERIYFFFMSKIKFRKEHIRYSQAWYEHVYHSADIYHLPERDYQQVMSQSAEAGEIDSLLESFAKFSLPENEEINWLEIACHHGKTPFTLVKKYQNVHFYMFDFSNVAVDWCKKYNPLPDHFTIWQGDVRDINHNGNKFDAFFDVITCLDVTEHLPRKTYYQAIKEIDRVCRFGGLLILKQGNVPLREHINILEEEVLVKDFEKKGFSKIDELPNRCHVFKRIC
jgi:cyclopropane fatty-acyl-phospholipid synthase-like methyltransferase